MTRLRAALSDVAPASERTGAAVRQGDPATQILRWARMMPADLIVIGAPGSDRPERPTGPVASVVVARSQCPVLTVPAHPFNGALKDAGLFSRIVCAVDLTPSSASVIRQALSIGWETKGHLTYVCVAGNDTATAPAAVRDALLAAIPPEASSWCHDGRDRQHGRSGQRDRPNRRRSERGRGRDRRAAPVDLDHACGPQPVALPGARPA